MHSLALFMNFLCIAANHHHTQQKVLSDED